MQVPIIIVSKDYSSRSTATSSIGSGKCFFFYFIIVSIIRRYPILIFSTFLLRCTINFISFSSSKSLEDVLIHLAFTCSKSIIETLKKLCETCSRLTIKTSERHHWCHSGISIVNFEQISHFFFSVFIVNFEQVNVSWVRPMDQNIPPNVH